MRGSSLVITMLALVLPISTGANCTVTTCLALAFNAKLPASKVTENDYPESRHDHGKCGTRLVTYGDPS
jgi:hypothetical protein